VQSDRPGKAAKALPEFLQGSSISGHMAAKHLQAAAAEAEAKAEMEVNIQDIDQLGQSGMTEEQRQEAFKRAYMAELERYNDENRDQEEVEVRVDKQGWDAEMNGDADEEELEDVEWEWCTDDEGGGSTDVEVTVNGQPKRLDGVDDEDLLNMTEDEFLVRRCFLGACWMECSSPCLVSVQSCYQMCLADGAASQ